MLQFVNHSPLYVCCGRQLLRGCLNVDHNQKLYLVCMDSITPCKTFKFAIKLKQIFDESRGRGRGTA